MNRLQFLLAGNWLYTNRGNEAIVRGTMQVLRSSFSEPLRVTVASYGPSRLVRQQALHESDPAVHHIPLQAARFSIPWTMDQLNRRLGFSLPGNYWRLAKPLRTCAAAMQIGGDNLSLDYGVPRAFVNMDRFIQKSGTPMVLWGASVGPFDTQPQLAAEMHDHLRSFTAIFVRETESLEYLTRHGIRDNVHLIADPAFVMEPVTPPAGAISGMRFDEAIGLNISGLMAKYVTAGDLKRWVRTCADTVLSIVRKTGRRLFLIPHVMNPDPSDNDLVFCEGVLQLVREKGASEVEVLPAMLSAAELKYVISRCEVFVGARTHSTIAAISSCVPTLSLAYSMKARGINKDMFGSLKYCIEPKEMNVDEMTKRVCMLLRDQNDIRAALRSKVPEFQSRAYRAGAILREIVAEHASPGGRRGEDLSRDREPTLCSNARRP